MRNKIIGSFAVFMVLVMTVSLVSAVGFSTGFHSGNPIVVAPGEKTDIEVGRLMASQETADSTIGIELIEGQEIASIIKENLVVPAGSVTTTVDARFDVPSSVAEGTEYKLTFKIKDSTSGGEGGMVTFDTASTISIPVLVQIPVLPQETPEGGSLWWLWLLLIIIIIIIIYLVAKKKKKKSPEKPVAGKPVVAKNN